MFLDCSSTIAVNLPALHYGIAVSDIDGDGRFEFVVAGYGGPNRVLRWHDGQLFDIAPRSLADAERQTICILAADYDGDGREELYFQNADTFSGPKSAPDRLMDHDPTTGQWSDLFLRPINKPMRNIVSGRSVAALDRRGNGRYSFAVANYAAPMRLYEQGSEGQLVDIAPAIGLNRIMGGRGLWTGPLSSDRADLFCANERGSNLFFRNTGLGTFLEIAVELGLHDETEHARGVAVLDADGDGRLDVAWANWEGPHRLMIRRADGSFKNRATLAMALPSANRNVIAADFDNCGFEELFFNNHGEPNRLFRQIDGNWRMIDAGEATLPAGYGTGAAVADTDGDGRLELLISHGEKAPQPLALLKGEENANGWIRFAPRTRFGAPARGSLIRLIAGGRTQLRVVCGGSGYLCQMEPVAHFGLGKAESVESVRIQWPDGATATLANPEIRRMHDVPYPTR